MTTAQDLEQEVWYNEEHDWNLEDDLDPMVNPEEMLDCGEIEDFEEGFMIGYNLF